MEQQLLFDPPPVFPLMPSEYRGTTRQACGYTHTEPREWTEREISWLLQMKADGYTPKQIAESMGRSEVSVAVKLKRIGKQNNTYNCDHVAEKYRLNEEFLQHLRPNSVLDVYCGERNFYNGKVKELVSNDKNAQIPATYNMTALKLLCKLYVEGWKFDLVDLDPFGSAFECFDLALKMANRGLIVTFGEMGHKRFKRLDFVSRFYGIERMADFTLSNLVAYVQAIAKRNKKKLTVWQAREWRNIGRVWFTIEPLKITEQWEKTNGLD